MDNQVEIKRAVDACVSITGYLRVVLVAIGLVAASPVALDIADLLLLREGPSLSAASAAEKGPTTNRPQDLIIGKWWSMAGSQKRHRPDRKKRGRMAARASARDGRRDAGVSPRVYFDEGWLSQCESRRVAQNPHVPAPPQTVVEVLVSCGGWVNSPKQVVRGTISR